MLLQLMLQQTSPQLMLLQLMLQLMLLQLMLPRLIGEGGVRGQSFG
jgi:hypothetical protein